MASITLGVYLGSSKGVMIHYCGFHAYYKEKGIKVEWQKRSSNGFGGFFP